MPYLTKSRLASRYRPLAVRVALAPCHNLCQIGRVYWQAGRGNEAAPGITGTIAILARW